MADLPSGFWSGWITILTLFSLAGLGWFTLSIYRTPPESHTEDEEPVWDSTLEEGNNTPPFWWFWLLLGSMVFSLVYLMLYPGLGSYPGMLNWSQGSQIANSIEQIDSVFIQSRERIESLTLAEIQNDNDLMSVAENIFTRECAACHGEDGRGQAASFPNLQDIDWQWGGTPEQIEQSIRGGRQANMLAWQAILGEEGVNNVVAYIEEFDSENNQSHPGKAIYDQNCVACHASDGTGNQLLGAPNLADDIWLYGGDRTSLKVSVGEGRLGVMPAFNQKLDDIQIQLLVALLAR